MENRSIDLIELPQAVQDFLDMPNSIAKNIKFNKEIKNHSSIARANYAIKDGCQYYSYINYTIKKSKSSYYLKKTSMHGFTLNEKGKLRIWFGENVNKIPYLSYIIEKCFKYTWFEDAYYQFLTKTLLEKILTRKITNPTQYFDAWCKSVRMKASGKLIVKLIKELEFNNGNQVKSWLLRANQVMTNMDVFIQRITHEENFMYKHHMEDMLDQANTLECKIDPSWSDKRMAEEHTRMTREIMDYEIDMIDDAEISYHPEAKAILSNNPNITLLDTKRKIYAEGRTMNHCIYTNYYNKIATGELLAFNYTSDDETGTLTLSTAYHEERRYHYLKKYEFLSKYNRPMSERAHKIVELFINRLNVDRTILRIMNSPVDTLRARGISALLIKESPYVISNVSVMPDHAYLPF